MMAYVVASKVSRIQNIGRTWGGGVIDLVLRPFYPLRIILVPIRYKP